MGGFFGWVFQCQPCVEDTNPADPNYIEDFLLCHRVFLESSLLVVQQLLDWFERPDLRDKGGEAFRILAWYTIWGFLSAEICEESSVAYLGCLSRIRIFSIPDPGSASKNLSILTQKLVSKLSEYGKNWKYQIIHTYIHTYIAMQGCSGLCVRR